MVSKHYFTLILLVLFFHLSGNAQQQVELRADIPAAAFFCEPETLTLAVDPPNSGILKVSFINGETVTSAPNNSYHPSGTSDYYIDIATIISPLQCQFIFTIPCKDISNIGSGAFQNKIEFEAGTGNLNNIGGIIWNKTVNVTTHSIIRNGNSTGTTATLSSSFLALNLYYLKLEKTISSDVAVNYHDSYNSSTSGTPNEITRTIRYINNGPDWTVQGGSPTVPISLTFSDTYSCLTNDDVNITKFQIIQKRGNNILPVSFTYTSSPATYNFTCPEITFSDFQYGDSILVIETLIFPNYQRYCVDNFCSSVGTLLNSVLTYGCPSDLCNSASASDNINRGPDMPDIKVWRLAPDPIANSIIGTPLATAAPYHGVWQYGLENQAPETWKFRIQNVGKDVAKNPKIIITDNYNSNFYYIKDIGNNPGTGTFKINPTNLAQNILITRRIVSPLSCSTCTASVYKATVDVGRPVSTTTNILAPGESVEVAFDIYYEAPSNDPNLFNIDKILNDWTIGVEYYDECSNSNTIYSSSGDYIAPNAYELDPFSGSISPNTTGNTPSKVFLKQDFTPLISTLAAAQSKDWGLPSTFEAHNFEFCRKLNINDLRASNLIANQIDFTNSGTVNLTRGGIRFLIDADQLLDVSNIKLVYKENGLVQNWPSHLGTIGTYVCGQSNQYSADFLFSSCPSGQALNVIYEILSNSDFQFDMRAACIPAMCSTQATVSKNPEYRLKTYLLIPDLPNNTLLQVPLTINDGSIAINCPGCQLPGVTVHPTSDVLVRTNFGLKDIENDGLADLLNGSTVPITSPTNYSHFNDLHISSSILGDELKIVARAKINNGNAETFSSLLQRGLLPNHNASHFDGPINLDYFYGELAIQHSNSLEFNVEPKDFKLEIVNSSGVASSPIYLTPADVDFTKFVYDERDQSYQSGKLDIILIDLSAALINTKLGTTYFANGRFSGDEELTITMNFKQKNNYTPSYGSFLAADNRRRSKVQLNLYLTGTPLVGPSITQPLFDAFTHQRLSIGQDVYYDAGHLHPPDPNLQFSISSDMLYFCETYSQYHYFYSIAAEIFASTFDGQLVGPNTLNKCKKGIQFQNTFSIGGESTNVFPFEFRKIPSLKNIKIQLPGTLSLYQFNSIDYAKSGSGIKLPSNTTCVNTNLHWSNLISNNQPPLFPQLSNWYQNGQTISTTVSNFPEAIADESLSITSCTSPLIDSRSILYGDEYFSETLFYPFSLNTCSLAVPIPALPLAFAVMQLEVAPNVFNDFVSNRTYGNTITTNQNTVNMNVATPTLSGGSRNVNMNVSISDNVSTDDFIENAFLYFDEPTGSNLFSSATISDNNATPIPMTKIGNRWYSSIGNVTNAYNHVFTISAQIGNCLTHQSITIPIYFSSTCDPATNTLPAVFCYTVNTNCTVGFPNDVTELFPPAVTYQLCQNNTARYTFHTTTTDIYNLEFDLGLLDLSLQNITATFSYKETAASTACVVLSAVPVSSPVTHFTLIPSGCFDGIIKKGGTVYVDINFTPVSTFTGSPFNLKYNYIKYCGLPSPSTVAIPFSNYSFGSANCSPSVLVLPNTTICGGSSVTFTANILNGTPGAIAYYWQKNGLPLVPVPGAATFTTLVNSTDVVTVSVSINGQQPFVGTSNITVSSFSNCCYPSNFNNFTDIDLSGKIASQLPFTTYSTSSRIIINGNLTIDHDLTFNNCQNILMGPGASIEVLAGATLTVETSHISAVPDCNQMWSGIQVNTGGNVVLIESVIEDAETAVNLQSNASVHSRNHMQFLNNVIGINASLQNNPFGANSIGFDVDDSYFESTRNLIPPYPGQKLKPLTHGFAGIKLSRITSLSIGVGIPNKIHFNNLNFGIYSNLSNLTVDNCKFKDLINFDPTYPRGIFSGTGIFCESKGATNDLTQKGDNDNLDVDFDHCLNGILGIETGLRIYDNQMQNVDIGIRCAHPNYASINVERNFIDCNSVGISLLDNDRVLSLDLRSNTIDAGVRPTNIRGGISQTLGIDIADNNLNLTSAVKNIEDNQITLHENGRIGLHLTTARDYRISGNLVSMKNAASTGGGLVNMRGVQIDRSEYNTIACNNIIGESDLTIYEDNDAAMQIVESNENLITQNTMFWSSNGLRFIGNCVSNGGNPTQNIQKNVFGPNFYGLHYNVNSSVERQDFSGNQWRVGPVSNQLNGFNEISNPADFLNSQYRVFGNGFFLPSGVTPNWFFPNGGGSDLIIDPSDCGLPPVGPQPSIAKLIDLIGDTLNKSDFYKKLVWQYQIQLFTYLQKYPDLQVESQDLADFYIATAATNIAQIVEINDTRDNLLAEQSVLINTIKQRSLEIYTKSMLLKEVTKNLALDLVDDHINDSLNDLSNNLMASLDYLIMVNNTAVSALNNSISGKAALLSAQNFTLEQTAIYESLEKEINSIYFKLLDGFPEEDLENTERQQIISISELCPLIAGPAVYHARSIRKLFDPNVDYDDGFSCLQSGYVYRKGNRDTNSFSLFPNPSHGRFTLTYSIPDDGLIVVRDVVGRLCYSRKLNATDNKILVDLSTSDPGLYLYQIVVSTGNSEFNGKLIIE